MARNTAAELRNKVIYQVFTRNYKEGTFKAVEADLDRIRNLGVDIVYLLPIQPSGEVHRKGSMGSPYAIRDYRAIDPVQGTMEDFVKLSEAVHRKGMKLIIDVVYNHTSPDSWLSKNHPEWFYHKADGSFGNRVGEWWDVIDLDYTKPELWDYQIDTLKMWARYVDGFRCDVAPMVPIEFWLRARREVEEIRPGFIWIAESVEPGFIRSLRLAGIEAFADAEEYQAFDICYDYDLYDDFRDFLRGEGSLTQYLAKLNDQETRYPGNYVKLRCLENHDRPRAATMIPDPLVRKNFTAFNYFEKGITMIYAGEEASAEHHPTLFDRDTVDFAAGEDISDFLFRLSTIKKDALFSKGIFEAKAIGQQEDVICASYQAPAGYDGIMRRAVGLFSTTGRREALKVDLENGTYTNLLDGRKIDVFENTMKYEGEPVVILIG